MPQTRDDNGWWVERGADLSELTDEEQEALEANGGRLPPRFQHKYKEVIKPACDEDYEHCRSDIWNRLISLDTTLTMLEQMNDSPLLKKIDNCLVASSIEAHYALSTILWALYEKAILLISTLLYDDHKDSLELDRFRKLITDRWIKSEFKNQFQRDCNCLRRLSRRQHQLGHKINKLRNYCYAHRARDPEKLAEAKVIGLPELREAFEIAVKFFNCCTVWCGGHGYASRDAEKGIREICDPLIKNGHYINQVERTHGWVRMTTEELRRLNEMCEQYGLPNISPEQLNFGLVEDAEIRDQDT